MAPGESLAPHLAGHIAEGRVRPCGACGSTTGLRIVRMDSGPHWGKVVCDNCGERFNAWVSAPGKARRKRDGRSTGLLDLVRAAWAGEPLYCEICLRDERSLPEGAWMEAHHVIEHQHSGANTVANLRPVCNECHALIHWRRRTTGLQLPPPLAGARRRTVDRVGSPPTTRSMQSR